MKYSKMRIPFLPREKASIIKLRKQGLSINAISDFTGRSRSVVFRVLKRAMRHTYISTLDMRKLPYRARLIMSRIRWKKLVFLWAKWERFIVGESERPP